ncbi:MAG: DUF2314 domain-containing protein [Roseiarcus sp.]|jgi:uncharacterized protein YegJ (DUF2314 family)
MRARTKIGMSTALLSALLVAGIALAGDPNPVPKVPTGDPAMIAAFAHAAAGLDGFFADWRKPPPRAERFSVKIGLIDTPDAPGYAVVRPGAAGAIEWFWTKELRVDGAGFSARLANDPDRLRNVSFGQTVHFSREDIGDWMYWRDGKIVGNATACPALAHATAEERRQMKEQYGLDCG